MLFFVSAQNSNILFGPYKAISLSLMFIDLTETNDNTNAIDKKNIINRKIFGFESSFEFMECIV